MNRRSFLAASTWGALSFALARRSTAQEDGVKRPNIVFFFIDDQRNTPLGCLGDPIVKTPNIDRLAERGTIFRNSFVTTSICAASRASVMTGLTERTHGYTFGSPPVAEAFTRTTYPALLHQAGYRTGFVGKFGHKLAGQAEAGLFDMFDSRDRPYLRKQKDGSIRHIDEMNTEQAVRFVRRSSEDKPFCLSVSFSSTHAEDKDKENHYPCIDAVKGMYEDVTFPEPKLGDPKIFERHPDFLKESMNRDRFFWRWDTPEKYQKNMRAYYRLVTGVDVMIGRVLKALETKGFADNTIIIYAADNGYYMGNRGFAGKWSHYEESLRVPLIVMDPRRAAAGGQPKNVEAMALNIDIPATILDFGQVGVPAHYQGRSLRPWTEGKTPADWRTDIFVEHRWNHERIPKWEGVRDDRYKYARYDGQTPPHEFLHDLEKDPDELTNFIDDPACAEALARLRKRCDAYRDTYIEARKFAESGGA